MKRLKKLMLKNHEKLTEKLNDEQKEIFEKYCDCESEYEAVLTERAFCDGYCLGTKITSEAINGAEQILESDHFAC